MLACHACSLQSGQFVPVQYTDSVEWGGLLMRLAPTLLFTGVMIWMMSKGMSGMGGMGGMGGGRGGACGTRLLLWVAVVAVVVVVAAGVDERGCEDSRFAAPLIASAS